MKTKAHIVAVFLASFASLFPGCSHANAQAPAPGVERAQTAAPQSSDAKPPVLRENIIGGINFPMTNRTWIRLTGRARVLDANTLVLADGTEVSLRMGMDGPDLEQKGLIGGVLYPRAVRKQPSSCANSWANSP